MWISAELVQTESVGVGSKEAGSVATLWRIQTCHGNATVHIFYIVAVYFAVKNFCDDFVAGKNESYLGFVEECIQF